MVDDVPLFAIRSGPRTPVLPLSLTDPYQLAGGAVRFATRLPRAEAAADEPSHDLEPMASRITEADIQALRQFMPQSPRDVAEVQHLPAEKMVDLLAGCR